MRATGRRGLPALALSICLAAGFLLPGPAASAAGPEKEAGTLAPHVAGTVVVGFRPGVAASERAAARASLGVRTAEALSPLAPDAEVWRLPADRSVAQAIAALSRNPSVRYAEPDYLVERAIASNDPYYTSNTLWGMYGDATTPANPYGSGAGEAWAAGAIGSAAVYVGVIDEGMQVSHPDLDGNVWTNPFETVNGLDDDGNGYVDDVHGWDFFNGDASVFDGAEDDHGTHVAGTIGGEGGNGLGVAGVNWDVTMISAKFLGPGGGSTTDAVRAVDYITDLKLRHGLRIVATSNSWGGGGASTALLEAIDRGGDAGILFVAAAGNASADNDATDNYPSNYQCTKGGTRGWDCLIAVAAISSDGAIADFSSFGAASVDLGAPGVGVYSTVPTDGYASYSGTSMATPHVSGAVALCASLDPGRSAQLLRIALLASVTPTASLAGRTVTGGRLDVGSLVPGCNPPTVPVSGSVQDLAAVASGRRAATLSWTDTVADETAYEIDRAPWGGAACGTFATVATIGPGASSFVATGLTTGTTYCFRVRGVNGFNGGTQSLWSNVASVTTEPPPPAYTCAPASIAWVDPAGGTVHSLTDDASAAVNLPFAFRLYDATWTNASVSSNGFLRLGGGGATAWQNAAIPSTAEPNALVAAFWDDLNPGVGGTVSSRVVGSAPNRTFVASWVGVPHYNVAGSAVTFQILLEESTGAVVLQYLDTIVGSATYDRGASASVGLEDGYGEFGAQISFNGAALADGSAYRCTNGVTPPVAPSLAASSFPDGTVGVGYSASQSASGGVAPYLWSIASGALPTGLTISAATGAISGTPTAAGSASFTVKVQGADGGTSTRSASIRVDAPLAITTSLLAAATAGTPYSQTLASSGGRTPIAWSLEGGPSGISVSSSGVLSGTASQSGSFTVVVQATDALGRVARRTYAMSVAFGKLAPASGTKVGSTTVTVSWAAQAGATKYRYCVTTSKTCSPTTETVNTSASVALLASKTYTWQVQALVSGQWISANGSSGYWRFTTPR